MADETLRLWLEDSYNDQVALRVRVREALASLVTPFQRIEVYDSWTLGRILCLGGRIVLTSVDEAIYSEGLVHPALACHPAPRRVCILGGGDGGVAREVARHPGVESIDVVEIDEGLVALVREFFPGAAAGLDDPLCHLLIDDAHRFLATEPEPYDVVIVDADSLQDSASEAVLRLPFGQVLRQAVASDGILVAPLGLPTLSAATCRQTLGQLRDAFAHVHCYSFSTPSVLGHRWVIAWCSDHLRPTPCEPFPQLGETAFWDPVLQPGLFVLPRQLRQALG